MFDIKNIKLTTLKKSLNIYNLTLTNSLKKEWHLFLTSKHLFTRKKSQKFSSRRRQSKAELMNYIEFIGFYYYLFGRLSDFIDLDGSA